MSVETKSSLRLARILSSGTRSGAQTRGASNCRQWVSRRRKFWLQAAEMLVAVSALASAQEIGIDPLKPTLAINRSFPSSDRPSTFPID